MKDKDAIRPWVDNIILAIDSLSMDFVYPDLPGIEIHISVGGMLSNAQPYDEGEFH